MCVSRPEQVIAINQDVTPQGRVIVEGDATVCVIRGTRRHLFDMAFVLEWEARRADGTRAARGALRYADVDGPAVTDGTYEAEVEYRRGVAADCRRALGPLLEADDVGLRAAVAARLGTFVAKFQASC